MKRENVDIKPIVSAIVSTYNSEKFIKGKIEDLLSQTIADRIEIIIVDSGSQQNEEEVVKPYLLMHSNIKYVRTEERETIYKAWNRGIKIAEGEFITNANTDDRLRKDAYEILSNELINNPEVALVYADQYITHEPNKEYKLESNNRIERLPEFDYVVQLDRCIVYSQPMWRASLHYNDNIWFDENLEICGDHEFELNLSMKYKMLHVPQVLGSFYIDPGKNNISHRNISLLKIEKDAFTYSYMRKYVGSLTRPEVEKLLKKFFVYTRMSVKLFLFIVKFRKIINRDKHIHLLEFTYLFTAVLLEHLDRYQDAIKCCKKILKTKNYERIENHLLHLQKIVESK